MILLAIIFLAITAFVIAAVAGVILNIVRALRGKPPAQARLLGPQSPPLP